MNTYLNDWDFALFSANLYRYLPAIKWEEHTAIYSRWKSRHDGRTDHHLLLSGTDRLRDLAPGVLLLYHLGHHLQLPLYLARAGICFDIILDREVYLTDPDFFDRLRDEMGSGQRTYRYLFSDDASLLLQVRESLRAGRHLLVFADGTSGTRSMAKDRRIAVPFLESEVQLKKGIPFMAYLFGLSIYPIVCMDGGDGRQYTPADPISVRDGEDRDTFIYRALSACYAVLAKVLYGEPWRWECWPYLHSNGMLRMGEADRLAGQQAPMLLLAREGRHYLFDRRYYCAQTLFFCS